MMIPPLCSFLLHLFGLQNATAIAYKVVLKSVIEVFMDVILTFMVVLPSWWPCLLVTKNALFAVFIVLRKILKMAIQFSIGAMFKGKKKSNGIKVAEGCERGKMVRDYG